MAREGYSVKGIVSRRTMEYAENAIRPANRSITRPMLAVASRTNQMESRSGLTSAQRSRIRRAGQNMISRLINM